MKKTTSLKKYQDQESTKKLDLSPGVIICPRIPDSSPRFLNPSPSKAFLIYQFLHMFFYYLVDYSDKLQLFSLVTC